MSRPKGSLNKVQARTHSITVKLNDAELAYVKKHAKELNLKLAVYIRLALR